MYDMRFKIRGPLIGWESLYPKSKKNESFKDKNENKTYDVGEDFEDLGNGNLSADLTINEIYQKPKKHCPPAIYLISKSTPYN